MAWLPRPFRCFEHLELEFLLEYDVFAPLRGANTVHQPPNLFRGFLYCYYTNIYGHAQ